MKKIFNITGMHCGACATGVQMFLANTPGVISAKVDYDKKQAEVEYDEGKVKEADIIKAVTEAGFTATT